MSRLVIAIENEGEAWGAYDLICLDRGVAGSSRQEVKKLVQEAVAEHVRMLRELGETAPPPRD